MNMSKVASRDVECECPDEDQDDDEEALLDEIHAALFEYEEVEAQKSALWELEAPGRLHFGGSPILVIGSLVSSKLIGNDAQIIK